MQSTYGQRYFEGSVMGRLSDSGGNDSEETPKTCDVSWVSSLTHLDLGLKMGTPQDWFKFDPGFSNQI